MVTYIMAPPNSVPLIDTCESETECNLSSPVPLLQPNIPAILVSVQPIYTRVLRSRPTKILSACDIHVPVYSVLKGASDQSAHSISIK